MNSSRGYQYLDGYAYILTRIMEISSHYLLRILSSIRQAKISILLIQFLPSVFLTGLLPNSSLLALKMTKKKVLILIYPLKKLMGIDGSLFILDILFLTPHRVTLNSVLVIHRQSSQKEFYSLNPRSSFRYQQGLDGIMDRIISMGIL